VLELGAGYEGRTSRLDVESFSIRYYSSDMTAGVGVDFVANFEYADQLHIFNDVDTLGSVFILNVLEHTFEPIRILDNALSLLRGGGTLVVLTPALWPLHDYPIDAWRILPNFYEEYAKRRNLELLADYFEYIGFGPVKNFRNSDGSFSFPPPCQPGFRRTFSRMAQKLLNTYGRGMFYPSHVAVGAVFRVP